MARIALIVTGLRSSLNRTLYLAQQLEGAGHEILFLSPQRGAALIEEFGFDLLEIPAPWLNMFTSPLPRPPLRDRLSLRKRKARARQVVAHYGVEGLATQLRTFDPALVILNNEMHAHLIVTLSEGYRVALTPSMYVTAPSLTAPPLHHRQVPGRGLGGSRYAIFAGWAGYFARKTAVFCWKALRDWGGDHATALIMFGDANGVDIRKLRRIYCWQMPWIYRLPTMPLLPHALDLPKKHYKEFRFVGGRGAVHLDAPQPDLSAFEPFVTAKRSPGEKRILAVTGSMVMQDLSVVSALWDAAARHPEWRVLFVVLDRHRDALPTTPENVQLTSWVPQVEMLQRSDLVITHGGTSTVLEAIEAEVPLLIYPITNDNCGNAARVVYHNIGVMGHPRDDADAMATHIEGIFDDPTIPAALAEMKAACRREIDSDAAVKAVGDLLAGRWHAA